MEKSVAPTAKLLKLVGEAVGDEFELVGPVVIGRDRRFADIVIDDPTVSREHATIFPTGDGFAVKDGGERPSRNGTYVNGIRITEKVLVQNDKIRIRSCIFQYRTGDAERGADTRGDISVVTENDGAGPSIEERLSAEDSSSAEELAMADEDLKRMESRLRTFYDVSQAIGIVQRLEALLNQVMDSLFRVFGQAQRGFIMLQDTRDSGKLIPQVIRRKDAGADDEITISQTIIDEVMARKVAVLSRDARSDTRFRGGQSIAAFNIRSVMCAPLICRGEILGIIHIDTTSTTDSFDREDLKLLAGIASQAAISIKNAQLLENVRREEELRGNLARYMSPALVEQVVNGSRVVDLGGRLSQGSVLFSDIVGFTQMTLQMRPEEVVKHLNRYFDIMVEQVFLNGGTVDKFGGDAIIAVWGAPVPTEDDAFFAVKAALEMQNALFGFNAELAQAGLPPIEMGIGINSGTFLAGNIGSTRRMEYTVIGENVNLAQRIEAATTERQLYTSQSTFEQVAGRVVAFRMPPGELKGVGLPVAMYSVRGVVISSTQVDEELVLSFPVLLSADCGEPVPGQLIKAEIDVATGGAVLTVHSSEPLEAGATVTCSMDVPEVIELPGFTGTIVMPEGDSPAESTAYATHGIRVHELPSVLHRLIYNRQTLPAEAPRSQDQAG